MQTSLQLIADKAKREPSHRFRNLFGMLNEAMMAHSWKFIHKKAASGVDKVTAADYWKNFDTNVRNLIERLKRGCYRARLVLRKWIPKGQGKLRPLGLPVLEDKLLQTAVALILNAIFEADFLPCSHGYRPNRSPQQAALELKKELQFGRYRYVVEADIKGFFDTINHELLMEMLAQRIDDKPFLRLIKKWLKAGILEKDGNILNPEKGTPQGGTVSPVLANLYLHHVLDVWIETIVKKYCFGKVYLCRFADDFVVLFEFRYDAERFYRTLPKRLRKYDLELSVEKTRIIPFSRFPESQGNRFDFLGFEFRWELDRKRRKHVKLRTSRKKYRQSLAAFTAWCRQKRSTSIRKLMKSLNSKLRGYYNYYGVIGNYESLYKFYREAMKILKKWLNRRSQRKSYNYEQFNQMLKTHRIVTPYITQKRVYQLELRFSY